MLKLHHYRDFIAIADSHSVRAAARAVGVAQPAMSRSLRELEKELGVSLLERNAQGVVLTPAGLRFLSRARTGLNAIHQGIDEMSEWGGLAGGRVTVALSPASMLGLLPPVYQRFRDDYPGVALHFMELSFPAAEPLLRHGQIDFFIGARPEESLARIYRAQLVLSNRRRVYGRVDHPLQKATRLADLLQADWLYSGLRERAVQDLEDFFSAAGLPTPANSTRIDSPLGILSLLAQSDALCLMPHQFASLNTGLGARLQAIPGIGSFASPDLVQITRLGQPLTPMAQRLSERLMGQGAMAA